MAQSDATQKELEKLPVNHPVVSIFELDIHAATMDDALQDVERAVAQRKGLNIGMLNAAKIVNMQRNPELMQDVCGSDLLMADGSSVVTASRLLGQPLPERVAGIDLMYRILEQGAERGYRIYCLGASEEVSQKVAAKIAENYPGNVLAGRQHGYFSDEDAPEVAANIARAKPDVLFVAMTSPKKEQFMARWNRTMRVPVVHGVGGSFDVLAGKVKRAPLIWQRAGLEWLYRALQEPRRLMGRYLVTNWLFLRMFGREWRKRKSHRELKGR